MLCSDIARNSFSKRKKSCPHGVKIFLVSGVADSVSGAFLILGSRTGIMYHKYCRERRITFLVFNLLKLFSFGFKKFRGLFNNKFLVLWNFSTKIWQKFPPLFVLVNHPGSATLMASLTVYQFEVEYMKTRPSDHCSVIAIQMFLHPVFNFQR